MEESCKRCGRVHICNEEYIAFKGYSTIAGEDARLLAHTKGKMDMSLRILGSKLPYGQGEIFINLHFNQIKRLKEELEMWLENNKELREDLRD